jgi:pyrroline-5-carboxylate reductase
MARAMARGWGDPVFCTDSGSGRAQALVDELGGEVESSNADLARAADLVVLCHKPAQLDAVAAEAQEAKAVASVLGATPVAALQRAYPDRPVFRFMPNTPVEVNAGILCYSPAPGIDEALEREVLELFGRLGRVVTLEERLLEVATGVSGVGPAYLALTAEAWADAAVRRGLPAGPAVELAIGTLAGTAALLEARGGDTLGVRREVTSPGGSTARGLAALERVGLRRAFQEALDAVLDGSR